MNTYGLRSINNTTFPQIVLDNDHDENWKSYQYPRPMRNALVTFLKVHNLTLNILGYIPGVSLVSGSVRMGTGLLMCVVTLIAGDRNANQGIIIRAWYDEALLTGITQIARGALEAFVPFGWVINASLDIPMTFSNVYKEQTLRISRDPSIAFAYNDSDPNYPLPFWLLYLA